MSNYKWAVSSWIPACKEFEKFEHRKVECTHYRSGTYNWREKDCSRTKRRLVCPDSIHCSSVEFIRCNRKISLPEQTFSHQHLVNTWEIFGDVIYFNSAICWESRNFQEVYTELLPQIIGFSELKSVLRIPICPTHMVHKIILPYRCVMTSEHIWTWNFREKNKKKNQGHCLVFRLKLKMLINLMRIKSHVSYWSNLNWTES